jgi:hypothetical protein
MKQECGVPKLTLKGYVDEVILKRPRNKFAFGADFVDMDSYGPHKKIYLTASQQKIEKIEDFYRIRP